MKRRESDIGCYSHAWPAWESACDVVFGFVATAGRPWGRLRSGVVGCSAPPAAPLAIEEPLDAVLADYAGGIVPQELRIAVRDAYRAAQITQAQAAKMLGLSRPHLAGRRVVPPPLQRPRAGRTMPAPRRSSIQARMSGMISGS